MSKKIQPLIIHSASYENKHHYVKQIKKCVTYISGMRYSSP